MRKRKNREYKIEKTIKQTITKFVILALIISLNWFGLSAIIQTHAYLNDIEISENNVFTAGILDLELQSPFDFVPAGINIGETATRSVSFINIGNIPKYKVSAIDLTGDPCQYLDLIANLDGGDVEYTGALTAFVDFGNPTIFEAPDNWVFSLSLRSGLSETIVNSLEGKTCEFKFVFSGSQTRNDLTFMQGFNDTEEVSNSVAINTCQDINFHSHGFWKNHPSAFVAYLPQTLGNEIISTTNQALNVLNSGGSSMRNKLKLQLLAMKFNIANDNTGEYLVQSQGKTLNEIITEADNLLMQDSVPSNEILEQMKDLLDDLNNNELGPHRFCYVPHVKVLVPNGGEIWWVGRYYDLTWETFNLQCNGTILIDLWYSADSGNSFTKIVGDTENDGIVNWRVPLYNDGYYMPSSTARVKATAECNGTIIGWDMSDSDFCPPIDYDLLTPEEREQLEMANVSYTIMDESVPTTVGTPTEVGKEIVELEPEEIASETIAIEEIIEEEPAVEEEEPIIEEETTIEEVPTIVGIPAEVGKTIIEEVNNVVENLISNIFGEVPTIVVEEPINNDPVNEEPVSEEPINEIISVEEPATIEEPIIVPENPVVEEPSGDGGASE